MDIIYEERKIAGAPAILLYQNSAAEAATHGTVLFYHGLLSDKLGSEKELRSLAENGYLVVSIDNWGHGARKVADFDYRFHSENSDFEDNFIAAVVKTVLEAPKIVDQLSNEGLILEGKLGVCGISMGGFIAYGIASIEKRVTAACPIAGSPAWGNEMSPDRAFKNFYPVALLSQNGGADRTVPPTPAKELNRILIPYYSEAPERLAHVEFDGEGHIMSENGWYYLWENVLTWLRYFL